MPEFHTAPPSCDAMLASKKGAFVNVAVMAPVMWTAPPLMPAVLSRKRPPATVSVPAVSMAPPARAAWLVRNVDVTTLSEPPKPLRMAPPFAEPAAAVLASNVVLVTVSAPPLL